MAGKETLPPFNERKVPSGRVERLVSSGGVVFRHNEGRLETVLCGRSEPVRWSLAKGTPDPGETLEETALREVREETGLEVELEGPLGSIEYWFADREQAIRYHKTVHFYLMSPVGGHIDQHDPEFDVVQWFDVDEALSSMAYGNEAGVLRRAVDLIKSRQKVFETPAQGDSVSGAGLEGQAADG